MELKSQIDSVVDLNLQLDHFIKVEKEVEKKDEASNLEKSNMLSEKSALEFDVKNLKEEILLLENKITTMKEKEGELELVNKKKVEDSLNEIKNLFERIKELEVELEKQKNQKSDFESIDISEKNKEISKLNDENEELKMENKLLKKKLGKLKEENTPK
jgi:chromosome segregation ATPase